MQIQTPDIGVEKALVAEILVKVGDQIEAEQSIVVLESDKATVEVPSPVAGTVEQIQIKEGDTVKEGVVLINVKTASAQDPSDDAKPEQEQSQPTSDQAEPKQPETKSSETKQSEASVSEPKQAKSEADAVSAAQHRDMEITVPDLGVKKAIISEILVKVGDQVEAQQSLCVVESDKASVEVPSPVAGTITVIHVTLNQEVHQGDALAVIEATANSGTESPRQKPTQTPEKASQSPTAIEKSSEQKETASKQKHETSPSSTQSDQAPAETLSKAQEAENANVYAGPAVRKLARELGVVLAQVKASGEHGRILKDDVFAHVKTRLTAPQAAVSTPVASPSGLPALPDFSAFGGGEIKAMTRLQQVSVPQLSLNNFIPQVTQFDLADITDLEAWRGELKEGFKKQGISLTILAFIVKAVAHLLKQETYFAGHLADDQKSVLLRHEIHMGIAVATPDGLTVPVLRHPDQKSIKQIATELAELSQKARDKKLSPKELQGANFTITSLGSIGGTAFTPLVNWPQVAILGISPATMQPVWNGKAFEPRLMLPLSLSYDHRVINGVDAARFTHKLGDLLKDIRSLLL